MHTRNRILFCITMVVMLMLGMGARAVPDLPASAVMDCCCTEKADIQQSECSPEHNPLEACKPLAPCCHMSPQGSHPAPVPAASVQNQPRPIDIALQAPFFESDSLIYAEREFERCRHLPPQGDNIPIYLRTLSLLR